MSAIAAARLRAEAATKTESVRTTTLAPLAAPSSPPAEELISEHEESEIEPESAATKRSLKLCNWQNHPNDIFVENETELSISLHKNTTIALVGHFDFRVSRGAVNINGANIGAVTRDGQKARIYRAYVPATQPIFKIRGLDGQNHVQFTSCKEPAPFARLSPLFEDIWNTGSQGERRRTFGIVCCVPHTLNLHQSYSSTHGVCADTDIRSQTPRTTPSNALCSHTQVQKTGFVPLKTVPASHALRSSPVHPSLANPRLADGC